MQVLRTICLKCTAIFSSFSPICFYTEQKAI
jgi:hypothetical protein